MVFKRILLLLYPYQDNPHTSANILSSASVLHVWDEVLMMNKHCPEAVDVLLRTLSTKAEGQQAWRADHAFASKTTILSGDIRQILPIVRHGGEPEVSTLYLITDLYSLHLQHT